MTLKMMSAGRKADFISICGTYLLHDGWLFQMILGAYLLLILRLLCIKSVYSNKIIEANEPIKYGLFNLPAQIGIVDSTNECFRD